jgi:hypothetical protein
MDVITRIDPDRRYPRAYAAAALGVCAHTLACWAVRGFGPPFFKVGSRCMYAGSDLLAFLESRKSWGKQHD